MYTVFLVFFCIAALQWIFYYAPGKQEKSGCPYSIVMIQPCSVGFKSNDVKSRFE